MRLTKKNANKEGTTISMPKAVACYWKLKDIEDIEDELGIDLITLFKALSKPIYIKENYNGELVDKTLWCSNSIICGIGEPIIKVDDYGVYTKDYGKTWALTKEELEK